MDNFKLSRVLVLGLLLVAGTVEMAALESGARIGNDEITFGAGSACLLVCPGGPCLAPAWGQGGPILLTGPRSPLLEPLIKPGLL